MTSARDRFVIPVEGFAVPGNGQFVMRRWFTLLLVCTGATMRSAQAQAPTLPTVQVTATRDGTRSVLDVPYAVSVARVDSAAAARRLALDELLVGVPGVAVANRQNPAQDVRISIRGFGARSTFGVRGIRVLQDGIPVTLPDGQTPLDALDLENAGRVEVLRGASSALYGNAAGGVIDVRSAPVPSRTTTRLRVAGGGNSPLILAAAAGTPWSGGGGALSATSVTGPGFRQYSDQRSARAALRATRAGDAVSFRITDVRDAQNPGALTRAQWESDPTQADPLSVKKSARKSVRQADVAYTAEHPYAGGSSTVSLFGGTRSLDNPLTFAIIGVERVSGGVSLRTTSTPAIVGRSALLTVGVDAQTVSDDRSEVANCNGVVCAGVTGERGALRKDQRERVTSAGSYLRAELPLSQAIRLSAGARADRIRFSVSDHLVTATNPDESGSRTLGAVTPTLALAWRPTAVVSVHASVSSSFETPTTTELSNSPDGSSALNQSLQPQRAVTTEIGAAGVSTPLALRWDAAVYDTWLRDELVPVDIPGGAGRRYYRNAGRTSRRGAELGVETDRGIVHTRLAYTLSLFRYREYRVDTISFAGRRVPGIPASALTGVVTATPGRMSYSLTADLASALDVDDANTAQAPARALLGIAAAWSGDVGGVRMYPQLLLQNLTGARSVASINVNAAGGKFYEPAPGRTLLFRVSLSPRP